MKNGDTHHDIAKLKVSLKIQQYEYLKRKSFTMYQRFSFDKRSFLDGGKPSGLHA